VSITRRIAGRYRLFERVGTGGLGVLWAAWDDRAEQSIAVRIMERGLDQPDRVAHFRSSARAAARLSHPGIVRTLDEGHDPDLGPYFVTAWVDGWPLSAWFGSTPPWGFVRSVLRQLCDVLAHVHARGLAHLDLRPSTVLIEATENGPRVRVTDAGCARIDDGFGERAAGSASTLKLRGSLRYMAPEVCDAPPWMHGPWSDLYSLGLIAWDLLTGTQPDAELSGVALLMRRAAAPPPVLPKGVGGPHEVALRGLLQRLLAVTPAERPKSVAQVAQTLESLFEAEGAPRWADPPRGPKVRQAPFDESRGPAGGHPLWALQPGPLVGRTEHLAHLRSVVESAVAGQASRVVVIEGELGMGKSRLLHDLLDDVRERSVARGWLATFSPGSPPGAGLSGLLEDLLRAGRADAEGVARRVEALSLLHGIDPEGLVDVLPALVRPDTTPFARPGNEPDPGAEVGAVGSAHMLAGAFLELLRRATVADGVVVGLDDAHCAHVPEGLDLALRVLGEVDLPVCLVLTVEPGHPGTEALRQALEAHDRVSWLGVGPLEPDDAARYVIARLGLPDPDHSQVLATAGTLPTTLEATCDEVLDNGLCVLDGWIRLRPGFVLPIDPREVFEARMANLPATGGDALVADVVQGLAHRRVPLSPRVLDALASIDPHRPWGSALASAERARLMVRDPHGRWSFASRGLADWLVVRSGERAASWHRRWLKSLVHLEAGGRGGYGLERAAHANILGQGSAAADALAEAAAWALGPGQQALERGLLAAHQLDVASHARGDAPGRARAHRLRAELLRQGGHANAARDALEQALALLAEADSAVERGWCLMAQGWLELDRAREDAAEDRFQTALRLFEGVGDAGGACWSHVGLGYIAVRRGEHRVARTIGRQCEESFGTLNAARGVLAARLLRAHAADAAGDDATAEKRYLRLQEVADAHRWLLEGAMLRLRRARLALRRGRPHDALQFVEKMRQVCGPARLRRLEEWADAVRPALLAATGDAKGARRLLGHTPTPNARFLQPAIDTLEAALAIPTTRLEARVARALEKQLEALRQAGVNARRD
jgi:serine/threonine protein kinase/tetratricopeptide (TPR) repeat protein